MPKLITQYVTCPKCNGTSNNTKGLVCPECGGIGLGTFLKNDFLYWGYDLKPAKIIVRQSQLIFNYLVCAFCLAAGLGGFFYLIIWLRDNTFAVSNSFLKQLGALLSFWGEKHNFILFFWIGVLFIMFAYFYYARIKERNPKVKLRSYTRQNKLNKKTQVIPNNWQELKRFKTKIDVSKSCEESLLKIIEKSYELAKQSRHEELTPAHIALALMQEDPKKQSAEGKIISALFARLNIYKGKIAPKIEQELKSIRDRSEKTELFPEKKIILPKISVELKRSFIDAYLQAIDNRHEKIAILDLIIPMARQGGILKKVFVELAVNEGDIINAAQWLIISDQFSKKKYWLKKNKKKILKNSLRRSTGAIAAPVLNHFSKNITREAYFSFASIFVNREEEIDEFFKAVTEKKKIINLVGAEGIGRGIFIKNLAERIIKYDAPKILYHKIILELDLEKVKNEAAGMDFEKKMLVIILELAKAANTILVVNNITDDLWKIFEPHKKSIYLITASNTAIQDEAIHNIEFKLPAEDDLIDIIASIVAELEEKHQVIFSFWALKTAMQAGQKYYSGKTALTHAVNILKKIAEQSAKDCQKNIDAVAVAKLAAAETGLPYTKILKGE